MNQIHSKYARKSQIKEEPETDEHDGISLTVTVRKTVHWRGRSETRCAAARIFLRENSATQRLTILGWRKIFSTCTCLLPIVVFLLTAQLHFLNFFFFLVFMLRFTLSIFGIDLTPKKKSWCWLLQKKTHILLSLVLLKFNIFFL